MKHPNTKATGSLNKAALFGMLILCAAQTYAKAPSKAQMINWLSNPEEIVAEKVNIKTVSIGQTEEIHLQSGEVAYLSAVEYNNAGRNFSHGYILTRPDLKKAMHLTDFAGQSANIDVLSRNRKATLLQLSSSGSGQGTVVSGETILRFDGWTPKIFYRSESYDDFGYASERGCTTIESSLSFHDGKQAYVTERIETLTQKNCQNPKTAKRKVKNKRQNIQW